MNLNNLQPAFGAKQAKRRVGRGIGSGLGKTAGRVIKARSREPAAFTESVLKVARCLCSAGCRNVVSSRHLH